MSQEAPRKNAVRPTFSGCGMCGAVALQGNKQAFSALDMPAMVKSMHHRGPNGHGIFEEENVSFGHARLSILDLSDNGKQPMTKDKFTITYNGEVYNYPDLRTTLLAAKPSIQLESTTDTEVLLRLLEHTIETHDSHPHTKQGEASIPSNLASTPADSASSADSSASASKSKFPDVQGVLNSLNGFFGFGLWDSIRKRLLVVRDRYGIKPVYYIHKPGEFFAFASEVETLLASKLFAPKVDETAMNLFCTISTFFSQTTRTLVRDVSSMKPGHYMWIDTITGEVEEGEYYRLPSPDPSLANLSAAEATSQMKHLLEDSIQLRMLSDVPLSTFLSGGIDSSVITAIASHSASIDSKSAAPANIHSGDHPESHAATKPVTAFTVTYLGQGQNAGAAADEEYARKVSTALGPKLVNHQQVPVDPMAFTLADIDDLSDLGTFSDDDRLLTVLMNYRAVAQQGFSVILNGQGADEAMAGYIGTGWFRVGAVNVQDPDKILFDNILDLIVDTKLFNDRLKNFEQKARQLFRDSWTQYSGAPLEVAMRWLFGTSLHRILRFEDHLSMRSAIECRVPFLDYRLVDFCFKVPHALHLRTEDYTGKILLRELSKAYLPLDVCERPKQQFPNVGQEALNARLKQLILENIAAIRECPIIKHIWVPQVLATPEGLDLCSGSDFWVMIVYWRWWVKFASYGGTFDYVDE